MLRKPFLVKLFALAVSVLLGESGTSLHGKVALTPPMGWNSYDYYNWTVNEAETTANAEWMAAHLKSYGWEYVVVDFLWSTPLRRLTLPT